MIVKYYTSQPLGGIVVIIENVICYDRQDDYIDPHCGWAFVHDGYDSCRVSVIILKSNKKGQKYPQNFVDYLYHYWN